MTTAFRIFKGRKLLTTLVLLAVLVTIGIMQWNRQSFTPSSAAPAPTEPAASSPSPAFEQPPAPPTQVDELLRKVVVVAEPRNRDDYDRECSSGHACHFGPRWTDDTAAPGSHNGCDSRNDVLNAQLTEITHKPGTHECVVVTGTLNDTYTGTVIHFSKAKAAQVQIDHVYPLKRAWNFGAYAWPQDKRAAFANDVDANLIAVDGSKNQSKGARGPGQWMPPALSGQCSYIHQYLTVAVKYDLAVSGADRDAAVAACS